MFERRHVTLNISSTGIRLLSAGGGGVKKWGSMPLPPGLVKDGQILRPRVVGAVVNNLFKETGIPRQKVVTSLTGLSFIRRILSLPRLEGASLSEAVQRAARKEMLLPPEELYLCGQVISAGADEVSYFALGVPRKPIDALVQTLEEAGIQPYLVDLNPLALARVAGREEAVILNLEPDCFDIIIIAGGMPAVTHIMTPRGEGATLEDNLQLLADELLKTLEFYNNNNPGNPLNTAQPLLIAGELSARATVGEFISTAVGCAVEPLRLPLKATSGLPAESFAVNIGLALKKLKPVNKGKNTAFRDININVLSADFERGTRRLKLPHIVLSLVVVAGLALLLPVNQMRGRADAEAALLENGLAGVDRELEQKQLLLDKAAQVEDAISEKAAEAETVRQKYQNILSRHSGFARELELVTGALPAGAYFTLVDINRDQITAGGEADDSFTVISYAQALESLAKFSEVRIVSLNDSKIKPGDSEEPAIPGISFSVVITR